MSKAYSVIYTRDAEKALKKLDLVIRRRILLWITNNLEDCTDPYQYGKSLTGDLSGKWRYRIGEYWAIAEIQDEKILILILTIGHRRDIYKKKS